MQDIRDLETQNLDPDYVSAVGLFGVRNNIEREYERNDDMDDYYNSLTLLNREDLEEVIDERREFDLSDDSIGSIINRMRETVFRFRLVDAMNDIIRPLGDRLEMNHIDDRIEGLKNHQEITWHLMHVADAIQGLSDRMESSLTRTLLMEYRRFARHPVWTTLRLFNEHFVMPLIRTAGSLLFGRKREKSDTDRIVDSVDRLREWQMKGELNQDKGFFERLKEQGIVGMPVRALARAGLSAVGINRDAAQRREDELQYGVDEGGISGLVGKVSRKLYGDEITLRGRNVANVSKLPMTDASTTYPIVPRPTQPKSELIKQEVAKEAEQASNVVNLFSKQVESQKQTNESFVSKLITSISDKYSEFFDQRKHQKSMESIKAYAMSDVSLKSIFRTSKDSESDTKTTSDNVVSIRDGESTISSVASKTSILENVSEQITNIFDKLFSKSTSSVDDIRRTSDNVVSIRNFSDITPANDTNYFEERDAEMEATTGQLVANTSNTGDYVLRLVDTMDNHWAQNTIEDQNQHREHMSILRDSLAIQEQSADALEDNSKLSKKQLTEQRRLRRGQALQTFISSFLGIGKLAVTSLNAMANTFSAVVGTMAGLIGGAFGVRKLIARSRGAGAVAGVGSRVAGSTSATMATRATGSGILNATALAAMATKAGTSVKAVNISRLAQMKKFATPAGLIAFGGSLAVSKFADEGTHAQRIGDTMVDVMGMAGLGSLIGSVIPVVGPVVGGVIGAAIGLFQGLRRNGYILSEESNRSKDSLNKSTSDLEKNMTETKLLLMRIGESYSEYTKTIYSSILNMGKVYFDYAEKLAETGLPLLAGRPQQLRPSENDGLFSGAVKSSARTMLRTILGMNPLSSATTAVVGHDAFSANIDRMGTVQETPRETKLEIMRREDVGTGFMSMLGMGRYVGQTESGRIEQNLVDLSNYVKSDSPVEVVSKIVPDAMDSTNQHLEHLVSLLESGDVSISQERRIRSDIQRLYQLQSIVHKDAISRSNEMSVTQRDIFNAELNAQSERTQSINVPEASSTARSVVNTVSGVGYKGLLGMLEDRKQIQDEEERAQKSVEERSRVKDAHMGSYFNNISGNISDVTSSRVRSSRSSNVTHSGATNIIDAGRRATTSAASAATSTINPVVEAIQSAIDISAITEALNTNARKSNELTEAEIDILGQMLEIMRGVETNTKPRRQERSQSDFDVRPSPLTFQNVR